MDKENTIRYLYATLENQEPQISWLKLPRFEFIKDDARYQEVYEKAYLKAYDEQLMNKKGITANY
jgi:hypothetical protein